MQHIHYIHTMQDLKLVLTHQAAALQCEQLLPMLSFSPTFQDTFFTPKSTFAVRNTHINVIHNDLIKRSKVFVDGMIAEVGLM